MRLSKSIYIPVTAFLAIGMLGWSAATLADPIGDAAAVKATVQSGISILGTTTPATNTTLADTGSLTTSNFALESSSLDGSVPSLLNAQTLHATAIDSNDGSGETVGSEASLSNMQINVGGNTIGVAFAMAQATAPASGAPTAISDVEGLLVNGSPVAVTGAANQVIPIVGGQIVLNEQQIGSNGALVVNAIHIIISGIADVAVASATAGVTTATSGTGLGLPLLSAARPYSDLSPTLQLSSAYLPLQKKFLLLSLNSFLWNKKPALGV